MKNLIKYFLICLLGIIVVYCNEPAVTELVSADSDEFDIELLSPSTQNLVFTGYDTTGVVTPAPQFSVVISLSGIKNTYQGAEINQSLMTAAFFDKNLPVYSHNGRLIGYRTRVLGRVRFGIDSANVRELRIRFRENGFIRDTLLGFQHILYSGRNMHGQSQTFPYNSKVRFRLSPFLGNSVDFEIPTPPEVTGQLNTIGSVQNGNLQAEVIWNGLPSGRIEIVLGGILKSRTDILPLYRLTTKDDGKLVIPASLLKNIPFNLFDGLVITLIRRYRSSDNSLQDHFIVSQSVHNIRIDIP